MFKVEVAFEFSGTVAGKSADGEVANVWGAKVSAEPEVFRDFFDS